MLFKELSLSNHLANELEEELISSGGEFTEKAEQLLNEMNASQQCCVDRFVLMKERLELMCDFFEKKEKEAQKIKKSLTHSIDVLKDSMKTYMHSKNETESSGSDYKLKLVRLKDKLNINEEIVPDDYRMSVTTIVVDKKTIEKAVSEGVFIRGVSKEEVYALRSYVKKGDI